jgi:hypothetical protein
MSNIEGVWDCVVQSPLGERQTQLSVVVDNDTWTGTSEADGHTLTCTDTTLDGDTITWKMKITKPVPVTLHCTATIVGDELSGTTKAGAFGSFPMTGSRVS